jgi:hypothetical protein
MKYYPGRSFALDHQTIILKSMRHYKAIPIWSNISRTITLKKFRALVRTYFDNAPRRSWASDPLENADAHNAKERISVMTVKVSGIIEAAGISTQGALYEPYQGINTTIDIIEGIFSAAHYVDNPADTPTHVVNEAIGVYQNDRFPAFIRTVSPFYWLGQIIEYFSNLPFFVLDKLGYDGEQSKATAIGRMVKAVLTLVGGVIAYAGAILTILDVLGYWEYVKMWIQSILGIQF